MKPERTHIGSALSTLFCFARAGVFVRSFALYVYHPRSRRDSRSAHCGLRLTQDSRDSRDLLCCG